MAMASTLPAMASNLLALVGSQEITVTDSFSGSKTWQTVVLILEGSKPPAGEGWYGWQFSFHYADPFESDQGLWRVLCHTNLIAMASNPEAVASNLEAVASNLAAVASNLEAMTSNLEEEKLHYIRT